MSLESHLEGFAENMFHLPETLLHNVGDALSSLKITKHDRPSPYYWAGGMDGGVSPRTLPGGGGGYMPETGWAGRTIPVGAGTGIHPYYSQRAKDAGGGAKETYKYGKSGVPRWREGWYEPYFNAMVRAPMRQALGMGTQDIGGIQGAVPTATKGYGTMIDPSKSKFMKLSEAGLPQNLISKLQQEQPELMQPGEYTSIAGYDEPLIARGAEAELIQAGDLFANAETIYQQVLDAIGTKEEEAFETKEQMLGDIRTQRIRAQRGILPAQEQARAGQAATGMAYSAPAEKALTDVQQEGLEQKLDFKGAEYEAKETYDEAMEGFEAERGLEETKFKGEQERFESQLGDVFEETATEAEKVAGLPADILAGHTQYGMSTRKKATQGNIITGHDKGRYGKGIGGQELWQESEIGEGTLLEGVAGEVESFAQALELASSSLFQDLSLPQQGPGETY